MLCERSKDLMSIDYEVVTKDVAAMSLEGGMCHLMIKSNVAIFGPYFRLLVWALFLKIES